MVDVVIIVSSTPTQTNKNCPIENQQIIQPIITIHIHKHYMHRQDYHLRPSNTMELDAGDLPSLLPNEGGSSRKLDTFAGVFTPVCLSMFSAILFLRLGFIVGNAGLLETILQMVIAYTILVFTILSVSAISTNGAIEGGGIYYMSSRVLGPEFGGSIGTLFFIANVVSSALYLAGCVEGIITNFGPSGSMATFIPGGADWPLVYASILNIFNLLVCIVGAKMFARTTLVVFSVVLAVAASVMISFIFVFHPDQPIPVPKENNSTNYTSFNFSGLHWDNLQSNLLPSYGIDYTTGNLTSFASVFGVLFTGVTGVLAGANISGDLKNPSKSIPLGTLSGIIFTFSTYLLLFILSAASCSRQLLQNNYLYMQHINLWAPLVEIGISLATISASLSNLIGASRVLQAVAGDKLFGWTLNPIYRAQVSGNPIGAVLVTWFIIQLMLLIGSLNQIAQISAILFLFTYFSVNFACMVCLLTSAPNFRPSFRYFNITTTLFGMIGAGSMMFVINLLYSSIVIIAGLILMIAIHFRSPPVRWGDITQALIFHQVRKYLLLLDQRKEHVKFWRPRILLMVRNPRTCLPLIEFVNDLKKSGLFIIGHVELGNLEDYPVDPLIEQYPVWLKRLDCFQVKAFIEMTLAPSVREGLPHITRIAGLGAMKLNTVIFGFYDHAVPYDFFKNDTRYNNLEEICSSNDANVFMEFRHNGRPSTQEYVGMIADANRRLQKNVCLARHFQILDKQQVINSKQRLHLDIWPMNFFTPISSSYRVDNGSILSMQLACILHMVPGWKKSTDIRVFICGSREDQANLYEQWDRILQDYRIEACINIVIFDEILSHVEKPNPSDPNASAQRKSSRFIEYALNQDYLNAVNSLLKEYSDETAVTFLNLPAPPSSSSHYEDYLNNLQVLTDGLPPTLLVTGNDEQVVSTSI